MINRPDFLLADTKSSSAVDVEIRKEAKQWKDDEYESQRRQNGTSVVGPAGHEGGTGGRSMVGGVKGRRFERQLLFGQ